MDGKLLRKTFRGELQCAADFEGDWSVTTSIACTGGGKRVGSVGRQVRQASQRWRASILLGNKRHE